MRSSVPFSGCHELTLLCSLSSITGLITWACINLSYIRFYHGLKYQGISRDDFPFKAPLQPYASYFGLFWIVLIIIFNGYTVFLDGNWDTGDFIVAYITLVIFAVLFVFWKVRRRLPLHPRLLSHNADSLCSLNIQLFKRTKFVRLEDIDYTTGKRELVRPPFRPSPVEACFIRLTSRWPTGRYLGRGGASSQACDDLVRQGLGLPHVVPSAIRVPPPPSLVNLICAPSLCSSLSEAVPRPCSFQCE